MKKFVVLSPYTNNVQLIKDTGMIAYHFHKKYAFDSIIACHQYGEYPYLATFLPGVHIEFLDQYSTPENPRHPSDGSKLLSLRSAGIDILNLYGLSGINYEWICIYKRLNPEGKVYLKIDGSSTNTPVHLPEAAYRILQLCDLISIESKLLCQELNKHWPCTVNYIPNGYFRLLDDNVDTAYSDKENIILSVGRIGTRQKASEILLNAFAGIHHYIPGWKLCLAGPIEPEIFPFLLNYYTNNPELESKVYLLGNISDRQRLESLYRKAKIFCLSSRWEGFPLAGVEALREGCSLLLTNFQSAYDLTNNMQYGRVVPVDNTDLLQQELCNMCDNEKELQTTCIQGQQFAKKNFNWDILVEKIYSKLF